MTTQLSQPLLTLRQECEACESERTKCQEKLYDIETQVAALYQERLSEIDDYSFLSTKSALVAATAEKLKSTHFEINILEQSLSILEEDLAAAEKRAVNSTEELTKSISSSFKVSKKSAKQQVAISANVNFKEESSFFSGYSNASGSAKGDGEATLRYEISEMVWQPGNNLSKSVRDFRTHFEVLGENSGQISFMKREHHRLIELQRQYVDYLRMIIESSGDE